MQLLGELLFLVIGTFVVAILIIMFVEFIVFV